MYVLTEKEYFDYYKENHCLPFPQNTWKTDYTDNQLKSKYENYCTKMEKLNEEYDEDTPSEYVFKVETAMRNVHVKHDLKPYLEFFVTLDAWQQQILREYGWITNGFDACHYKERSVHPEMAYVEDNIVLLPRALHSTLDDRCWIGTNIRISETEHHRMWEQILGTDRINRLDEMAKGR